MSILGNLIYKLWGKLSLNEDIWINTKGCVLNGAHLVRNIAAKLMMKIHKVSRRYVAIAFLGFVLAQYYNLLQYKDALIISALCAMQSDSTVYPLFPFATFSPQGYLGERINHFVHVCF